MKQDRELVKRALVAYFKSLPADELLLMDLPKAHFFELHKLKFIQLRIDNNVAAVYRIENDGMLKRLKRYPVELGGTLKSSFYN